MRKNLRLSNILGGFTTDLKSTRGRLFLPTLGSLEAFAFWLGLIFVLSLYGVFVQFDHITSVPHFGALFFDFFIVQSLVVFSIIGYTHLSIDNYQSLSIFEQSKRITLTTLVFTPLATLVGKFIEIALGFQQVVTQNIFLEAMINTVLAIMLVPLLLYYFSRQYAKILTAHQRYHQKLIHQNAHLKARITPHFFFNMLNTLHYLYETDNAQSKDFLESIVKLYRVSFEETTKISLEEELDLCEHYLKVERYRYGEKLNVQWQLLDKDSRYDIAVPSLLLQMTLEKLILAIVETTTQDLDLTIDISHQSHWLTVIFIAHFPITKQEQVTVPMVDISPQRMILQQFYGKTASIDTTVQSTLQAKKRIIKISYPTTTIIL